MENRDKIEDKEYKRRIKELVERVEKTDNKDSKYTEQDLIERKEKLLEVAKSKIHPDFRDERILMVFTYTLRDFYRERTKSNDYYLLQKEINDLIQLIYDELKKPSASYVNYNSNSNRINRAELKDKRRVIGHIGLILGLEKMKELYEKKNFNELLFPKSVKREVMGIICVFGFITVLALIFTFVI